MVAQLQSPWPGGGGLEDIRSAIKQLTLRSRDSSSTATSGASSAGGGSNNGAQGNVSRFFFFFINLITFVASQRR